MIQIKLASTILVGLWLTVSMSPSFAQTSLSPTWERYVDLGEDAAKGGDYDTAIIQYQRARQAAAQMDDPLVSQCFVLSAEAHIVGAKLAKEFLTTNGRSRATLAQARRIQEAGFRKAVDELFVGEYENGCP